MLQSNPKREIPNFEKRRIREKELMVQSRGLVCYSLYNIDYLPVVTVYYIQYIIYLAKTILFLYDSPPIVFGKRIPCAESNRNGYIEKRLG